MTSPWKHGGQHELSLEAQFDFQCLEALDALEKITGGNNETAAQIIIDLFISMMVRVCADRVEAATVLTEVARVIYEGVEP